MKKDNSKKKKVINRTAIKFNESEHDISSDVLGSYTGTPADGGRPVQDADDL